MTVKTLTVSGLNVAAQVLGGTGLTSSTTNGVTTLSVSGTQSLSGGLTVSAGGMAIGTTIDNDVPLKIGTVTATSQIGLHLTSATGAHLQLTDTGNVDMSIGVLDGQSGLSFHTGRNRTAAGTELMRLTSAGAVGIGTTTPGALLDVYGGNIRADAGGANNLVLRDGSIENHKVATDAGAILVNYAGYNSGTTYFRDFDIANGKNVVFARFQGSTSRLGIGTTSPGAALDIRGSATTNNGSNSAQLWLSRVNAITVFQGLSFRGGLAYDHGIYQKANSDTLFIGRWGGSGAWQDSVAIDTAGNVGIGTGSPGEKLSVLDGNFVISKTSYGGFLKWTQGSVSPKAGSWEWGDGTGWRMDFGPSATPRLSIYDNGNVGIGTTSPVAELHVKSSGYGGIFVERRSDAAQVSGALWFDTSTSGNPYIRANAGDLQIYTGASINVSAGTERLRLTAAGSVGIGKSAYGSLTTDGVWLQPNDLTHISATTANGVLYVNQNGTGPIVSILKSGAEKFQIDTSGKVGIGTSSPTSTLHVVAPNTSDIEARFTGGNNQGLAIQNGTLWEYRVAADTGEIAFNYTGYNTGTTYFRNTHIYNGKYGTLAFFQGSTGRLGIGTTDPKATLHANGTFAITTATSGTANSVILAASNYALPNATTCSGRMYWVKNTSASAITMTSAGGTIDGVAAATGVSLSQYDCYTVISDGTNWFII